MKPKNSVFFGENGRTSTSANYLANKAKECYEEISANSDRLRFVAQYRETFNGGKRLKVQGGNTIEDAGRIVDSFEKMGKYKALIAWLREAIKARAAQERIIKDYSFEKWALEKGHDISFDIKCPDIEPFITEDEVIGELSIKERGLYYSLEAEAANLGSFIHPRGAFSKARKELVEKTADPITVLDTGNDTFVVTYEPTASVNEVDTLFMSLQELHRSMQAQLNGIKHKIEMRVASDAEAKTAEYGNRMAAYNVERSKYDERMKELINEFNGWKLKELEELRGLKIIIPDSFVKTVEEIEEMGR